MKIVIAFLEVLLEIGYFFLYIGILAGIVMGFMAIATKVARWVLRIKD